MWSRAARPAIAGANQLYLAAPQAAMAVRGNGQEPGMVGLQPAQPPPDTGRPDGHAGVVPVGVFETGGTGRALGEVLREPAAGEPREVRHAVGPARLRGAELIGEAGQPRHRPVPARGPAD